MRVISIFSSTVTLGKTANKPKTVFCQNGKYSFNIKLLLCAGIPLIKFRTDLYMNKCGETQIRAQLTAKPAEC